MSLDFQQKVFTAFNYEKSKKTLILDNKIFETCKVKFIETGFLRKKFVFVHFDGKRWNILLVNKDYSKLRNIQLE